MMFDNHFLFCIAQAGIYRSKLTIETLEQAVKHEIRSGVVLTSLLLSLNIFHILF